MLCFYIGIDVGKYLVHLIPNLNIKKRLKNLSLKVIRHVRNIKTRILLET